jgi:hypothetical protein
MSDGHAVSSYQTPGPKEEQHQFGQAWTPADAAQDDDGMLPLFVALGRNRGCLLPVPKRAFTTR